MYTPGAPTKLFINAITVSAVIRAKLATVLTSYRHCTKVVRARACVCVC